MESLTAASLLKQEEAVQEGRDTLDGTVGQTCHVRRVSEAILGEIFMFALTLVEYTSHNWLSNGGKITTFNLVCKKWRRVAIRTPKLWASLEICDNFNKTVYKKAEQWLKRAGSVPKTLELRIPDYGCEIECSLSNKQLAKFLTSGPMLDRLSLSCRGWHCIFELLRLLENQRSKRTKDARPWYAVKKLELSLLDGWCRAPARSVSTMKYIYDHLPPVTSFNLAFEHCDLGLGEIPPPMHIPESFVARLTKFSFSYGDVANISNLLPVLKACQYVEDLSLSFGKRRFNLAVDRLWETPSKENSGFLPRVRRLKLWSCDTMKCLEFFNSPLLEELDLTFGGSRSSDETEQICESCVGQYVPDFIDRSQCHNIVRILRLDNMVASATVLESLLRRLPCLVHFVMECVEVEPSLYQSLGDCRPPALPVLRSLSLLCVSETYAVTHVKNYIEARRGLVKEDGTPLVDTELTIEYEPSMRDLL